MNKIYNLIAKNRWLIPPYIFTLLIATFLFTKFIMDFEGERGITFLIQPLFYTIILMLSVYFLKNNRSLYLLFITFSTVTFLEVLLYMFSPYKTMLEKNGGFYYVSPIADIRFEHTRKPNQKITHNQKEFSINYTTNSFGFRGEEPNIGEVEILLMGDSFIEGWGVDNDSTISKVLENKLECENCVMNAGVAASDLIAAYHRAVKLLPEIKPKILILNINDTDYNDIFLRYIAPHNRVSIAFEFFYGASFIVRHLSHLFLDIDQFLIKNQSKIAYEKEVQQKIFETLHLFQELSNQKNIRFFVVLQPYLNNLDYIIQKSTLYPIHLFLEENKFSFYNAHIDLQNYPQHEKLYWPIDQHFNNKGANVFGNLIYKALNEEYKINTY